MKIVVVEPKESFWDTNEINVIVNGFCYHNRTDTQETDYETIEVCERCGAWRCVRCECDEWYDEVMIINE